MTPSSLRKNAQLREGDSAPSFSLLSDAKKEIQLGALRGKIVVLYFYPRDNTPGCTIEARDFNASLAAFEKAGAVVLGVSKDSIESHCKFRDKFGLRFPLLADPKLSAHQAYGVWGEKNMYGKKILGTIRSTFVIDKSGKLVRIFSPVKVAGHVEAVLAAITGASGKSGASKASETRSAPTKPKETTRSAPTKPKETKPSKAATKAPAARAKKAGAKKVASKTVTTKKR